MLSMAICLFTAVDAAFAVDLIGYLPYYRMNASYNTQYASRSIGDAG